MTSVLDRWVSVLANPAEKAVRRDVQFHDAGHGYDVFGFDPRSFALSVAACRFVYDHYFRVESRGIENVPRQGPAILAGNHSGLLPIDAAMLVNDVARRTHPPRVARAIGDFFIPFMPWIGTAFSRIGMVSGTRANFERLLRNGELVLVFPEGTRGIGKGFARRYQLEEWHVGHVELALAHRVPVIPVAVVGAEEAWPQLARIDRFHMFGAPFLPVPATPIPMPVRFHIRYGKPIYLHERWPAEQADDPDVVREAASAVKHEVESLIACGLRERKGLFH